MDDLDTLAVLFDAYRVFYKHSPDIEGAKAFLLDRLTNNDAEIFICFDDMGRGAGFVQLYPLFSSTRMKKLWLLNDLYVHPEYRNLGYSIQLIERAKELCRLTNACGLMLETSKENLAGNNLYPKTGFVVDNEHHYYHWDNEGTNE